MRKNVSIQFGFEIPLYNRNNLYKIYSKPIVIRDDVYKFHLDTAYVSLEPNFVTYTERSRKSFCIHSTNQQKTFCERPNNLSNCSFESLLKNNLLESNCMKKLNHNNFMVKIGDNFYFTILKPLVMKIDCLTEDEKRLKISRSMNVPDAHNCSIEIEGHNKTITNAIEYRQYEFFMGHKITWVHRSYGFIIACIALISLISLYYLLYCVILFPAGKGIYYIYEPHLNVNTGANENTEESSGINGGNQSQI